MEAYFRNRASVDDPDLVHDRRRNDGRLKSRFEHIFAKYEKDFTGIGDEIDLDSGEVVVNNGHLQSMRHEVDPGKGASSQLVRAFAHDLERESEEDVSDEDTGLEEEGSAGKPIIMDDDETDSSESKSSGYTSSGVLTNEDGGDRDDENSRTSPMEPDELSSDFYQDETDSASRNSKPIPSQQADITNGPHFTFELQGDISTTSTDTSRDPSPAMLLENMPFFKESMEAMQNHSKAGGPIDQEAIQALGKSIASQLAQFMSQGASKRNGRPVGPIHDKASPWNYPPLPMDKRQRTPTPPPPALSSSAALFGASPGGGASLWAPQEHPRPRKRRRTKLRALAAASDDDDEIDPLQSDSPRPSPRPSPFNSEEMQIDPELEGSTRSRAKRRCYNCGETETATFRTGPDGDLCNACGMYFYRYGLLRPLFEPEESPPLPEPKPGTFSVLIPAGQGILQGELDEFDISATPEHGNGSGYAANTARRVVAGGAHISRFTVDEDESIIRLHEIEDLPWETIGRLVSGRSAAAVQCRYNKALKDQDTQARRRLLGKKMKVKQPQRPGEPPEVMQLDEYDDDEADNASPLLLTDDLRLLGELPMRDEPGLLDSDLKSVEKASRKAFNRNLNDPDHWAFKKFTPNEDQLILRLRNIDKLSWEQIQWHLPERTALALEKHYRHNLVPKHLQSIDDIDPALLDEEDGSKRFPFTTEEDQLILKMRDEENMSFAEMTDYLDGRSEQSLAIRYRRLTRSKAGKTDAGAIDPRLLGDAGAAPGGLPSPVSQGLASASTSTPTTPSRLHSSTAYHGLPGALPVPQTPAAPISSMEEPPRPAEVGPSAWSATQPASKGPLPFQPARKAPVPIASAPKWPVPPDPFVTKPIAVSTVMGPKKPGRPMPQTSATVLELVAKMSAKSGIQVWPSQAAHSVLIPGYHVGAVVSKKSSAPARTTILSTPVDTQPSANKQRPSATNLRHAAADKLDDPMVHSGPFYTPVEDVLAPPGMCTIGTSTTEDKKTMIKASERPVLSSPGASMLPGPNGFSADDDRAIRKWREKDGLCWSDIAERLPGRTQQTVTDRYYDVIIGKQAESKAALLAARYDPNSLHGTRYTDEESEKVLILRDQGLNWQEMAEQMPGRTPVSIQNHFYGALMGPKRGKAAQAESTPAKPSQPTQPRAGTPLLKQALNNQTKRASLGARAPTVAQDKLAQYGMTPPPGKRALAPAPPMSIVRPPQLPPRPKIRRPRDQKLQSGAKPAPKPSAQKSSTPVDLTRDHRPSPTAQPASLPTLQQQSRSPSTPNHASEAMIDPMIKSHEPSASFFMEPASPLPPNDDMPQPPFPRQTTPVDASRRSRSVDFAPPSYPETPLRSGPYGNPYYREATPNANPVYETPARGGYQSMPYFVAPTAVMVTPSIEQDYSEPQIGGAGDTECRLAVPFRAATSGTPPVRNFAKPATKASSVSAIISKPVSSRPKKRPAPSRSSSVRKRLEDEIEASVNSPALSDDEHGVASQRKSTFSVARHRRRSRHRHRDLVSEESAEESEPEEPPSGHSSPERVKSRRRTRRAPTLERDSESDYQLDEDNVRPARRRTGGRSRRAPSPDDEDDGFEKMLEDQIVEEPRNSSTAGQVAPEGRHTTIDSLSHATNESRSIGDRTFQPEQLKHSAVQSESMLPVAANTDALTSSRSSPPTHAQQLPSVQTVTKYTTVDQEQPSSAVSQPPRTNVQDPGLQKPRSPRAQASEPNANGRDLGWPELIALALEAAQGRALMSTEVIQWIKEKFSCHRNRDITSKVRVTLSVRPDFAKVLLDQPVGKCKTAWRLAAPGDTLVNNGSAIMPGKKSIEYVELDDDEDDELASDLPVLPSPAVQRGGTHGHPATTKASEPEKEVISLLTSDTPVPEPQSNSMPPPPPVNRASSALPHGHPQNGQRRNSELPRPLPIPTPLTKRSASHRHSDPVKRLQQSPAPRAATPSRSARKGTPSRAGAVSARSGRAFTPRFEPIRRFSLHEGQPTRAGSVQVDFGRAGSVALPGGRRVLLAHGISAQEQEEEGADGVDELA